MRKQIAIDNLNELKGRTIENVGNPFSALVLTFTDGTFAAFTGSDFGVDSTKLSDRDMYTNDFVELGIVTMDDFSAYCARLEEERKRHNEEHDRRQYERLKAKFEKSA